MRNMDQHPDFRAEPYVSRGQRPSGGKENEVTDDELAQFLEAIPPSPVAADSARLDVPQFSLGSPPAPASRTATPSTTPRLSRGKDGGKAQKTAVGSVGTSRGKKSQVGCVFIFRPNCHSILIQRDFESVKNDDEQKCLLIHNQYARAVIREVCAI